MQPCPHATPSGGSSREYSRQRSFSVPHRRRPETPLAIETSAASFSMDERETKTLSVPFVPR
jgi:hypothetical protein